MELSLVTAIGTAVATTLVLGGLVWFLKRRLRLVERLSFPLTIAAVVGGIKVFTLFDVGDLAGLGRILTALQQEGLKKFDLAAQSFTELGRRFPKTKYDTWWRAGQIYDKRLDKKPQAVEAYRQVSQSSTHYADAQRRIGRLSR